MPKKSKKSKSKRQTLKNKYKVLKKVKEHHRKKRKEAKKNGTHNKGPKDPGIPNNWPFKEELIQMVTELTKKVVYGKGKVINLEEEKPEVKEKKKREEERNLTKVVE